MIYEQVVNYLLVRKKILGDFDSEDELENAKYNLSVAVINLEKLLIVYTFSAIMGVLLYTFTTHFSYLLLRRFAGGWHALKTSACSFFSVIMFVIIPKFAIYLKLDFNNNLFFLVGIFLIVVVWKYAPADTEKNPLVLVNERKKMRLKAIFATISLLIILTILRDSSISNCIFAGLSMECFMITPMFYKLFKRRYANYEDYKITE